MDDFIAEIVAAQYLQLLGHTEIKTVGTLDVPPPAVSLKAHRPSTIWCATSNSTTGANKSTVPRNTLRLSGESICAPYAWYDSPESMRMAPEREIVFLPRLPKMRWLARGLNAWKSIFGR